MRAREQFVSDASYALKIDLRFGTSGRKLLLLVTCPFPGKASTSAGRTGSAQANSSRDAARYALLAGCRTWTRAGAGDEAIVPLGAITFR